MDFEARLATAEGSDFLLGGTQVIGRGQDCELTLNDSEASRRHARVTVEDQQVWVEDLGSSNGTRVNGAPVAARSSMRAGDVLEIGNTRLLLTINGQGAASADDATVIAADATVLASAAASGAADLPGAWTDDESGDKTQFLATGGAAERPEVQRQSAAAHLVIADSTGSIADVLELTLEDDETVWEIGRDAGCDIQLNDPTVSGRHAQLIHKDGRWRAVNLISSNGLIVNGEKRLSVYLSDGDQISLGSLCVVFFADANAAPGSAGRSKPRTTAGSQQSASGKTLWLALLGAAVLVAAGGAAWFMLG